MRWELFVGLRYLFTRRRENFIRVTTVLSILSLIVGVAALIIVLGVMNGFGNELRNKIVGFNYHVYIEKYGGIEEPYFIIDEVKKFMKKSNFYDDLAIVAVEYKKK